MISIYYHVLWECKNICLINKEVQVLGVQVKNKLNLIEESLQESLPVLEKNLLKSSNKDKYKDKEERIIKFLLLL